jgi:hypothetical protein
METRNVAEASEHGFPTRGLRAACHPTGLIMQPAAIFVIFVKVIKLHKYFGGYIYIYI